MKKYVVKFLEWIIGYTTINIQEYYDLVDDIKKGKILVIDNNSSKNIKNKKIFIKDSERVISGFTFEDSTLNPINNSDLLVKDCYFNSRGI